MTAQEWLRAYAEACAVPPPTAEEVDQLLALAGLAAHTSERQAAPITCWLAARAGLSAEEALAIGQRLAEGQL